jgi:hypothetical protein
LPVANCQLQIALLPDICRRSGTQKEKVCMTNFFAKLFSFCMSNIHVKNSSIQQQHQQPQQHHEHQQQQQPQPPVMTFDVALQIWMGMSNCDTKRFNLHRSKRDATIGSTQTLAEAVVSFQARRKYDSSGRVAEPYRQWQKCYVRCDMRMYMMVLFE